MLEAATEVDCYGIRDDGHSRLPSSVMKIAQFYHKASAGGRV